jgi:CRP-like cAMP-binding protein
MSFVRVEGGAYLCRQGDDGDEAYVVVSGQVEILLEHPEQKLLDLAGPGTPIGEFAALTRMRRTATLRARGPTQLLVINGAHFRALLREHPEISFRVIELLIHKVMASSPR